jgi:GNAT superfamily N-acetyltransferase
MKLKLVALHTKGQKKRFVEFIYGLYAGDRSWVDSSLFVMKMFLYQTDTFTRQNFIRPIAVREDGRTLAQCMFIHDPRLPYLQIGFFDALQDQTEAVGMLLDEAQNAARITGVDKVVIGLHGHVSYGVGILMPGRENRISFDSLYNKPYYCDYFEVPGFERHTLSTYTFKLDDVRQRITGLGRTYEEFSFRTMRLNDYKNEMILFGKLCNGCLRQTFLYFDRDPENLFELMSGLKPLLRPEHLIFALKNGREAGFFFWHPDYNAVLPPGRKNSLVALMARYFLLKSTIDTVKINAVGVLPEYQRTGAIVGLFDAALRRAPAQFKRGETNFVWDSNRNSRMLNLKLGNTVDRRYAVYCMEIAQGGCL